jgi:enoyl-CoA hydratase/carnithine racemase
LPDDTARYGISQQNNEYSMTDELVTGKRAGTVATLTLNSPSTLNALSDAVMQALHDRLDALAETPEIRAVVLTSAGKAFCAALRPVHKR